MDPKQEHLRQTMLNLGKTRLRPLCIPHSSPNNPLLCLESRPSQSGHRCIPTRLGLPNNICLPTILHDLESEKKGKIPPHQHDPDLPLMASTGLVSTSTKKCNRQFNPSPSKTRPTNIPLRDTTPSHQEQESTSDCLENIGEPLTENVLPLSGSNHHAGRESRIDQIHLRTRLE